MLFAGIEQHKRHLTIGVGDEQGGIVHCPGYLILGDDSAFYC